MRTCITTPGARMDRQDRRIGGPALRPQGRQHHGDDLVVPPARGATPRRTGRRRSSRWRRRTRIRSRTGPGSRAAGRCCARRSCHACRTGRARGSAAGRDSRQHLPVRHVVRHLAQPVHVVAERQQARRLAGQHRIGVPHPAGPRHLAERADMRQAGRAIPGLEQRLALAAPPGAQRVSAPPRTARPSGAERAGSRKAGGRCEGGVRRLISDEAKELRASPWSSRLRATHRRVGHELHRALRGLDRGNASRRARPSC